MSRIEQVKTYEGRDLETIFFRPMFSGDDARSLGIKVMYNMPVPTTLHFWKRSGDVLQRYEHGGWAGSTPASRWQKTIPLSKVKAEASYSAEDYFSLVYELITNRPDVNLDDLTGTELEAAETALFRQAVAESIRATMWLGDRSRAEGSYATFDGFLRRIIDDASAAPQELKVRLYQRPLLTAPSGDGSASGLLRALWDEAPEELRAARGQDSLVYLVTSDVWAAYEDGLDSAELESAYAARQQGRSSLSFRGIPLVDIRVGPYLETLTDMPGSLAILTDRRNLALAVNTRDFPGTQVRMWYNPDLMENRQRAVFMAGCDYLLPEMLSVGFGRPDTRVTLAKTSSGATVTVTVLDGGGLVKGISAQGLSTDGTAVGQPVAMTAAGNVWTASVTGSGIEKARATVECRCGGEFTVTA